MISQHQIILVVHLKRLTKQTKLMRLQVVEFTSHQLTNKVILELVIYSEFNRRLVLQHLTQTLLTFQD